MNASGVASAAWRSYVDKWLAVQPWQSVALAFVDPAKFPGHVALAALEQELLAAAYGIREPQVAVGKLHWWAEELAGAATGGGRHPLTRVLFAEPRAHAVSVAQWLAPVQSALAQLEQGTAADFQAQLAAAAPLHGALAALETAWWYGPGAAPDRAARLAVLAHLLHALRRLEDDAERDRLPLPMTRLARFGLDRARLREEGKARTAAVMAQLDDLHAAWREVMRWHGPLTVFRALEARQLGRTLRRARHAKVPLHALQRDAADFDPALVLAAWRVARHWRAARRAAGE